mmetsp:Transcript_51591/g.142859  ORF Transcript_51591/g.142859 Transcript_51591/m.142859 type:complete len:397 (+) Transcript_51591:14-1204(+)
MMHLTGLKSLTLQFNASDSATDETAQELMDGIGSLSQLEKLCLGVQFCPGFADMFLEALGSCAQKLRGSLSSLRVDCTHCWDITDEGVKAVCCGIRGLPTLADLQLSFKGARKVTDAGASALGKELGALGNLEDLDLDLEECECSCETIEGIVRFLRGLKRIRAIAFTFTAGGIKRYIGSTADVAKALPDDWWTSKASDHASAEVESGRLRGRKVLLLTDFKFWDEEVDRPRRSLEAQGARVIVASKQQLGTKLVGHNGMCLIVDASIDEMYKTEDYKTFDAVFIPGGAAPQRFRNSQAAHSIIEWMASNKRVVAAICHGVKALGAAGVLSGVRCTSYIGIKLAVQRYGGEWVDQEFVVHEQCGAAIITARTPPDLPAFCVALLAEVEKRNPPVSL